MRSSVEYPKTENLFNRDPETHKLILGDLRNPAFAQVCSWHVTEKIDGTNMRILYSPGRGVEIRGRSDRANIPGDLLANMQAMFTEDKLAMQFDEFLTRDGREGSVTIYGEGYGPGIQKGGGNYAPDKRFRMFDVMYHWTQERAHDGGDVVYDVLNSWATQETVAMIASGLNVPTAPFIKRMTLDEIVAYVDLCKTRGFGSPTALADHGSVEAANAFMPEGVIARTDPYLYTHRGSRIMFKLKGEDLP